MISLDSSSYSDGYSAGFQDALAISRTTHKDLLDKVARLEEQVNALMKAAESLNHDLPY